MEKRTKRSWVSPDVRRQWLRRFEEDGESPPQIAEAENWDVRTVRRQLELAREEREAREARSFVLRQALEQHYADLVKFAEKLDQALIASVRIPLAERSDRKCSALREHLPRSPIWRGLDRWEAIFREMWKLEDEAKARLRAKVTSTRSVEFARDRDKPGFHADGLSSVVVSRLRAIAQVSDNSLPLERFTVEPGPGGLARIAYGAKICADVPPEQEEAAKEFIAGLMNEVGQWPEYEGMAKLLSESTKLTETLREELATIILRRVVPGRCKYCPL